MGVNMLQAKIIAAAQMAKIALLINSYLLHLFLQNIFYTECPLFYSNSLGISGSYSTRLHAEFTAIAAATPATAASTLNKV